MLRSKLPISQIFNGLSSDKIFQIKTDDHKSFRETYNSHSKIDNPVSMLPTISKGFRMLYTVLYFVFLKHRRVKAIMCSAALGLVQCFYSFTERVDIG